METNYQEPLYTIGIVAKLLGVCCATLRIWEKNGLIKPVRLGKNRYYSKADLDQLEHVKKLIQKNHFAASNNGACSQLSGAGYVIDREGDLRNG